MFVGRRVLARRERPAVERSGLEHGEEIGGCLHAEEDHWVSVGLGEDELAARERRETGERALHVAVVHDIAGREVVARVVGYRVVVVYRDEAVRLAVWRRLQEDRVGDTEDCGVGADGDGERQQGDGGEARILAERAETVRQILRQLGEPFGHAHAHSSKWWISWQYESGGAAGFGPNGPRY